MFLILSPEHLREKGKRHSEKHPGGEKKAARTPRGENIEHRPDEINGREAFGHWEMDCVVGAIGSKQTVPGWRSPAAGRASGRSSTIAIHTAPMSGAAMRT